MDMSCISSKCSTLMHESAWLHQLVCKMVGLVNGGVWYRSVRFWSIPSLFVLQLGFSYHTRVCLQYYTINLLNKHISGVEEATISYTLHVFHNFYFTNLKWVYAWLGFPYTLQYTKVIYVAKVLGAKNQNTALLTDIQSMCLLKEL